MCTVVREGFSNTFARLNTFSTAIGSGTSLINRAFMSSVEVQPEASSTLSADRVFMPNSSNIASSKQGSISETTLARPLTFNDLKRLIQKDDRFKEVTVEQIQRVKMMHDKFMDGAVINFNYGTLLVVASVLAGLGLVSNSTATIIASMLVSPIMGPVVAIAYGTTIFDRKLVRLAWKNELLSLFYCILIGAIIGAITGMTPLVNDWPTPEMAVRCTLTNFFIGFPIAFFSGLGVAVSLLDDQTNSLVGVAISASLLPPAVNCGIIWVAYAFYKKDKFETEEEYTANDFRRLGWISLGLTLINIAMIWISSMIMFRLKEILPIEKKIFWGDLGIARKIYQGKAVLAEQVLTPEVKEPIAENLEEQPL